jgi:hypothetical protein
MRGIAPMAATDDSGRCEDGTRPVATMAFIGPTNLLAGHGRRSNLRRPERARADGARGPELCDDAGASYEPCTAWSTRMQRRLPVVECEYAAGHQFAPMRAPALAFFSQF